MDGPINRVRRPWVAHLEACIAAARGDVSRAADGFARAAPLFDAIRVPIWAAARFQLARLRGGEEGRALHLEAARVYSEQGVRDPGRLARLFAPGVPG